MPDVTNGVDNTLQKRGYREQQSREKKRGVNRDTEADGKSNQYSRRCWFKNCQQHFFHNASFVDPN